MDKRKRRLTTLIVLGLLLIIPFITLLGYSIWIVPEFITVKPELGIDKIMVNYYNGSSAPYDGNISLPASDELGPSSNIVYYYKASGDTEYIAVDANTSSGPINAGEYDIKIEYIIDGEIIKVYEDISFTIEKKTIDLSNLKFEDKETEYNGTKQYIEFNTNDIPAIVGYTYDYDGNCTDVGTYNITLKFTIPDKNNYNEIPDKNATLTITQKDISDVPHEFTNNKDSVFYYTSNPINEIESTFNLKQESYTLIKGTDYNVTFNEKTEIGSYSTTVTGMGNYKGTKTINYEIKKSLLFINLNKNENHYDPSSDSYYFTYSGEQPIFSECFTVTNSQGTSITPDSIVYNYKNLSDSSYTHENLPVNVEVYMIKVSVTKAGYEDTFAQDIFLEIKPKSISSAVITLSQTTYTYSGSSNTPSITSVVLEGVTLTNNDYGNIIYDNNIDATTNSSKAGVTITGQGNYNGTATVLFTINQATPTLTLPVLSNNNFIEGEKPSVTTAGYGSFNGNKISGNIADNILSQTFTTGSTATEAKNITYTFIPSDKNSNGISNFVQVTSTKSLTMYAVAFNSTTSTYYGTIEKGVEEATSGNKVVVLPNIQTTTNFYPTIKKDLEIGNGISLILSFDEDDKTTGYKIFEDGTDYVADSTTKNPAYAKINSGIKVTVLNGGILVVGAYVGANGVVGKHSVLMNDGIVYTESGSTVYAYGYIKGSGTFEAGSGSSINDILRFYDFPGARYAAGMYFKTYRLIGSKTYNNILPFQSYSMHNISCKLKVFTGAYYYARSFFNVSNVIYSKNLIMIGPGGLFNLTTEGGYVERTVENTTGTTNINGSYTTTNQETQQKEIYLFNSDLNDNSITVNMTIAAAGIDAVDISITTSKSLAMPMGMMDLIITSGHTLDLKVNSYKLLPGSKIVVEEGATLKLDTGCNLIVYNEYYDDFSSVAESGAVTKPATFSYYNQHKFLYNSDYTVKSQYKSVLEVNGEFLCSGSFGGIITTKLLYDEQGVGYSSGYVKISNDYATLNRLSSIKYLTNSVVISAAYSNADFGGVVFVDKQTSKMYLYNGISINENFSSVAAGEYNAIADANGNCGWYANSLYIGYDLNGGTGTNPSDSDTKVATGGYIIQSSDIPTVSTTREGYTFNNKWALDPDGINIVVPGTTKLYASTILYAVWEPITYNITYINKYYNEFTSGNGYDTNNNPSTYTIKDVINLLTPIKKLNGENLIFGGWFTNESCTDEFRTTSIINSTGDVTLYAYWYPANTTTFNVEFDMIIDSDVEFIPEGVEPSGEKVPVVDNIIQWAPTNIGLAFNNDTTIDGYFVGWFFDEACTVQYNGDMNTLNTYLDTSTNTLTLYGKIAKKATITIDYAGGTSTSGITAGKYYYCPSTTITLPTLTKDGYKHNGWLSTNSSVTISNNSVTITESVIATISAIYLKGYVITVKNDCGYEATVTVYINGTSTSKKVSNGSSATFDAFEGDEVKVHASASGRSSYLDNTDSSPYVVTDNKTFTITSSSGCITADSIITLANGTQKRVDELLPDDLLLVWNHETGSFDYAPAVFLIHQEEQEQMYKVINLIFSNGKEVKIVYEHGFFSIDEMKYVYINEQNVDSYIGNTFASTNDLNSVEKITLIGYYITEEITKIYSPITFKHLNCFVDGILTVTNFTNGLVNYFELDENMKYDEEKMKQDIETYGLFTYEEWAPYASYETFMAFNGAYVKVSVGKGQTTIEEIISLIKRFLVEDNFM